MKRLFMAFSFLTAIFSFMSASYAGNDIAKLWKDYDAASKADRPQKQIEILDQIGKLASRQHLTYDYYRYLDYNLQTQVNVNWKLRDSLVADYDRKVREFDEPILTYVTGKYTGKDTQFVRDNEKRLRAAFNPEMYSSVTSLEKKCIINDYEFIVWRVRNSDKALYVQTLKERFSADAVAMYDKYNALRDDFFKVQNNGKSTQDDYLKIYDRLVDYRKECGKFKGIDADLVACWSLKHFEDMLNSKEVSLSATEEIVTVVLRNLPSVDLQVKKNDVLVHSAVVKNEKKSFYVYDTVQYILPLIDDGEYTLTASKGEKTTATVPYSKHTISISQRHDAGGYSFYAADYHTGKPMDNVNVYLYRNGKLLATAENFSSANGYAYLPPELQKKIDSERIYEYSLSCGCKAADGHVRLSEKTGISYSSVEKRKEQNSTQLYLDRTLCKPGETLNFKALVYRVDSNFNPKAVENVEVTISIVNAEGKRLYRERFRTSAFGTVAGSFGIPTGERNGRWTITAQSDFSRTSKSFRVEDVVLPTFELIFEPQDHIAVLGETITVKGTVKGYSGHSPSSAKITYTVSEYNSDVKSGEIKPDASGKFSFSFKTEKEKYRDWRSYHITVKVADLTGETLEFSTSREASESISMNATLVNSAEGALRLPKNAYVGSPMLLTDSIAKIRITSEYGKLPVEYKISKEGKVVKSGSCKAGDEIEIDFSEMPQGIYVFESKATKDKLSCSATINILKISPEDTALDVDVEHIFLPLAGDVPAFKMGTTTAPMWACVSLYGPGNELLANRLVYLGGEKGNKNSVVDVRFDGLANYPEQMTAYVLYFRDCSTFTWNRQYTGPRRNTGIPLAFERFHDKASPASKYLFTVKTDPNVEAVVTVYDKALEAMSPNPYNTIWLPGPSAPYISTSSAAASVGAHSPRYYADYGSSPKKRMATKATGMVEMVARSNDAMVVQEEAAMMDSAPESNAGAEVSVRSDFRTTLAFEPFLHSDASGKFNFEVTTSDKASIYIVQLFAHNKGIHTGVLKDEMLVSVPVEVSIQEPRFLYAGDRYVLAAKLSNTLETPVSGTVKIDLYNGDDYKKSPLISSLNIPTTIGVGQEKDFEKEITVPDGISTLGIKLTFASNDDAQASDAIFVKVPVYPSRQIITEAHSSVLLAGADRDALVAQLRALFVNGPGEQAQLKEISIRDMLDEALPTQIDTTALNAISLSGALMAAQKLEQLRPGSDFSAEKARLAARLEACRNSDGGYGWLPEMSSNALVTAVVLERLAGTDWAASLEGAAKYLDNSYVAKGNEKYWWCGISLGQYLYVRSMYPDVKFSASNATSKELRAFRKEAKNFLAPRGNRGLQGQILIKTRRALTLRNLANAENGSALAKAWGIRLATASRVEKSLENDILSLKEYMVEHRSGGAYYPNAVMPWRGLLESELYAHTLLHRLLGDDRISIWMMVQKETQQWGSDPACIDALAEVLSSSEETLQTKVIALTANWDLPFAQIKESGNGMKISRTYYREDVDSTGRMCETLLRDGDLLHVGDKVVVVYNIWNEENRSFVRLTASRPASLRPEKQFSGSYGWRPRNVAAGIWFVPQGYRNVKAEATEYWFDVYPEENSSISETFYVTQKGYFSTPALVIESLYAPHYRANDKPAPLSSN